MRNKCINKLCKQHNSIITAITVSFVVLSVVPYAVLAETRNLVTNNSFEKPIASGSAQKWHFSKDVSIVGNETHEGKKTLVIRKNKESESVTRVAWQNVDLEHDALYQLSGWIKKKKVNDAKKVGISVVWYAKGKRWLTHKVAHKVKESNGWTKVQTSPFIVPEMAIKSRVLCFMKKGSIGKVYFDDIELHRIIRPMQSVLVYPNYRGIYAKTSAIPIKIKCWIPSYPKQQAYVSALLINNNGTVVKNTTELAKPGSNFMFQIGMNNCKKGLYKLNVILKYVNNRRGDISYVNSYKIHVINTSAKSPEIWIDKYNRLIVNGKPMMPIGVYTMRLSQSDANLLANTPFNCVMPYAFPDSRKNIIKRALKNKFFVIASFDPGHPKKEVMTAFKLLHELRNNPAVLAWYVNDELSPKWIPMLRKVRRLVSIVDPSHPIWMVTNHPNKIRQYVRTFDVIGADPYPIGATYPISQVSSWTKVTAQQVADSRPLWQVIQTHNLKANYGYGTTDAHTPSPVELRNMIWQAVTHGANGIILYSLFDMQRNPDRPFKTYWPHVKKIAGELNQWAPVLLSIEPSPKVKAIYPKKHSWLGIRTATWHGRTFVFACNNTRKEHTARFLTSANIDHVRAIDVLNRKHEKLTAKGNVWQDTFKPLAVKMYELNGNGIPLPPPQDVHPPKPAK